MILMLLSVKNTPAVAVVSRISGILYLLTDSVDAIEIRVHVMSDIVRCFSTMISSVADAFARIQFIVSNVSVRVHPIADVVPTISGITPVIPEDVPSISGIVRMIPDVVRIVPVAVRTFSGLVPVVSESIPPVPDDVRTVPGTVQANSEGKHAGWDAVQRLRKPTRYFQLMLKLLVDMTTGRISNNEMVFNDLVNRNNFYQKINYGN